MNFSRIRETIDRLDSRLGMQVMSRQHPAVAEGFARLSNAANHSKLWIAIAGLQAAFGGRSGRRAALRGVMSVALSSALVNGILKPIMPRTRPPQVPGFPALVRRPRSSSFPSGHAASAAAFATATAMEQPLLAVPAATLAAAVAASRVSTGVHHTSDVIAGAAIGAAIAGASALVWPLLDSGPAEAPEVGDRRTDREAATGIGMTIVANPGAGGSDHDAELEKLGQAFPDASVLRIGDECDLAEALRRAARSSQVLGVVGGDGTVRTAAEAAMDAGVPLAVFPGGTLNHFARDLGIESFDDAIEAARYGPLVAVDTAALDKHLFLNTASFGGYCQFVSHRQRFEGRLGKWPAALIALGTLLLRGEPTQVTLDGESRKMWMIFIGNCGYDPPGFAPSSRAELDDRQLDVRIIDASAPAARLKLAAAMAFGRLESSPVYSRSLVGEMCVEGDGDRMVVAVDGELVEVSSRFTVRKSSKRLSTFVNR